MEKNDYDFAVTVRQRGIYNCIVTKCLLMNPETGATREAACLWDTGATHTCIPQSFIADTTPPASGPGAFCCVLTDPVIFGF